MCDNTYDIVNSVNVKDMKTSKNKDYYYVDKPLLVNYKANNTTPKATLDVKGTIYAEGISLPGDITITNSLLQEIQEDIEDLQDDVGILQSDMTTAKTDISGIKTLNTEQNTRLSNLESADLNLQSQLDSLALINDAQTIRLNNIDILNTTQNGRLDNIESLNTTQNTKITALETSDASQNTRLNNIESLNTTQNNRLDSIESINTTQTTKISALETSDASQNTRLNNIETLNTTQNGRLDSIESINTTQTNKITALETSDTSQNTRLTNIETLNTTQNNRLDSIESINTTQTTKITALETSDASQNTRLNNIETLNTTQNGRLDSIESINTTQNTKITALENKNSLLAQAVLTTSTETQFLGDVKTRTGKFWRQQFGPVGVAGGTGAWFRIAQNGPLSTGSATGGTRAAARFILQETTSSNHGFIEFIASTAFGGKPTLTLLNSTSYFNTFGCIRKIRMLDSGTYDGSAVDVYIVGTAAIECIILENEWTAGWTGLNFEANATIPAGFVSHELDFANDASFAINRQGNYFVVDGSGKVGIGNQFPTQKLDVRGQASINQRLYVRTSQDSGNDDETGSFVLYNDATTTNLWRTGVGDMIRLKQTGWVDILGPTAIYNNLLVSGHSEIQTHLIVGYKYNSSPGLYFAKASSYGIPAIQGVTSLFSGAQNIAIAPVGGNVGIGTGDPKEKLHIVGNARFDGLDLLVRAPAAQTAEIRGTHATAAADTELILYQAGTGNAILQTNATTGNIIFRTNGANERMRITNEGKVSIGTEPPGNYTLRVSPDTGASRIHNLILSDSSILSSSNMLILGGTMVIKNFNVGLRTEPSEVMDVNGNCRVREDLLLAFGKGIKFIEEGVTYTYPYSIRNYYTTTDGDVLDLQPSGNSPSTIIFRTGTPGTASRTEQLRISTSGNVGIGTNNPGTKLDVVGSARITNGSGVARFNDNGDGIVISSNDSNKSIGLSVSSNGNYGGSGTAGIKLNSGGSASFITNGNIRAHLANNGRVGINTQDPGTVLDVNGVATIRDRLLAGYTPSSTDGIAIGNSTSYGVSPHIQGITSGFGTNKIAINPAGGNVGIGTNDPVARLQVNSTSTTFNVATGIRLGTATNYATFNYVIPTTGTEYLLIQGTKEGVGNDRNIILNPVGGNVGIGRTNPGERLTINGNMHIRNWTALPDGTYNSTGDRNIGDIKLGNEFGPIIRATYPNNSWTDSTRLEFYTAGPNIPTASNPLLNPPRMVIEGLYGDVGIGYTYPEHKLDVNGAVRAQSFRKGNEALVASYPHAVIQLYWNGSSLSISRMIYSGLGGNITNIVVARYGVGSYRIFFESSPSIYVTLLNTFGTFDPFITAFAHGSDNNNGERRLIVFPQSQNQIAINVLSPVGANADIDRCTIEIRGNVIF